eukprot:7383630-Lingulodinium_polyedra.AAC.1
MENQRRPAGGPMGGTTGGPTEDQRRTKRGPTKRRTGDKRKTMDNQRTTDGIPHKQTPILSPPVL